MRKANALDKDAYTNFTAVKRAINAVVRDKNITDKTRVDAMAKAIEDAMAALVEKPTAAPTKDTYGCTFYKPTATPRLHLLQAGSPDRPRLQR